MSGGRTADGTKIQLWDCLNNAAQKWRAESNGSLVNPNSGKCLDADAWGTANGHPDGHLDLRQPRPVQPELDRLLIRRLGDQSSLHAAGTA